MYSTDETAVCYQYMCLICLIKAQRRRRPKFFRGQMKFRDAILMSVLERISHTQTVCVYFGGGGVHVRVCEELWFSKD